MASVSWEYPKDKMLACSARRRRPAPPRRSTGPVAGEDPFRYAVSGSNPPWKPLRASMAKVYIQFPPGIARASCHRCSSSARRGDGQLVNYRFRSPYYIVDRLFGAAELRLGGDKGDVVRIERTDGGWHAEELTMSQDDSLTLHRRRARSRRGGGAARPAAPGHAPEPAHAGHAHRRPVGRRARGHDLVIAAAPARG